MIATSTQDQKRINQMMDDITGAICHLYSRWQDERQYENITDYGDVLAQHLPSGFSMIKMTKRPFGFKFGIDTMPKSQYQVAINSKSFSWKRVM
jgi:hypothetical protein